jgi:hypothetical protein
MDQIELDIQRQNTAAFIAVKPTTITLTPREQERVPSGGYKYVDQVPRFPQTFRIIELGMQSTPPILQLQDGTQRQMRFWLLGPYDAVIEPLDWWETDDGRFWQIGDVVRENEYEQRGLVVERGK